MSNRLDAAGGGGGGGVPAVRSINYFNPTNGTQARQANRGNRVDYGRGTVIALKNNYRPMDPATRAILMANIKKAEAREDRKDEERLAAGLGVDPARLKILENEAYWPPRLGPPPKKVAAAAERLQAYIERAAFYARRAAEAAGAAGGGDPDVLSNINYYNPTMAPPNRMSNGVMRVVSEPGEPMMAVPVNNYGGRRGRRGSMNGGSRRTRKRTHRKNRRYSRRN
jgi:hypothetical protein